MKIEFTKKELGFLLTRIQHDFDFCEMYHPTNGGCSMDLYIEDEEMIRMIYRKLKESLLVDI
jgi:hypothetical protein